LIAEHKKAIEILRNQYELEYQIKEDGYKEDNMIYIGIKPGDDGAIAVINKYGVIKSIIDMPDNVSVGLYRFLSIMICAEDVLAFVDSAYINPEQSFKSIFYCGEKYGEIWAVLKILNIPYKEISQLEWKEEFSLTNRGKYESVKVAEKVFPSIRFSFNQFWAEPCDMLDYRAEALLIAEYCRRKWNGV
jgi:hypothetical protein